MVSIWATCATPLRGALMLLFSRVRGTDNFWSQLLTCAESRQAGKVGLGDTPSTYSQDHDHFLRSNWCIFADTGTNSRALFLEDPNKAVASRGTVMCGNVFPRSPNGPLQHPHCDILCEQNMCGSRPTSISDHNQRGMQEFR